MRSTDALILLSHGSLLCGAAETLHEHAVRLRAMGEFAAVEIGFLNYTEPPFACAVERCVAAGARRIVVVPYFLVPGKFVSVNVPRQLAAACAVHPGIEFVVSDAIGYDARLADAVLQLAAGARPIAWWTGRDLREETFCERDPECPLFATPSCPLAGAAR